MTAVDNLVQREQRIPGLATILAPDRLANAVHARLGCRTIDDIRLDYIRYKPGMNCIARYVMQVQGVSVSAYAKAHGPDAQCKLEKAGTRAASESVLGPGRVLIDKEGIVFSVFPNDAKLKAMQRLAEGAQRERLLQRVFGTDSPWQEGELDQSLNYKPERRYVARIKLSSGELALLKFHTRQGYHRALRNHGAANIVGHSSRRGVIAHRWLAGETLRDLGNAGRILPHHIAVTASALAAFHNGSPDVGVPSDRVLQIKAIEALGTQVGFLLPGLQSRAAVVAAKLAASLAGLETVHAPVHGDFYDKQVVIHGSSAALIDMDSVRLDDPLVDLGNYAAHLERLCVSGGQSRDQIRQHLLTLTSSYLSAGGAVRESRLRQYMALGLFSLIHQPFRDFEEHWPEKMEQILSRVEDLIGGEQVI